MSPIENIAGTKEHQAYLDKFAYIFAAEYLVRNERIPLPLGYNVSIDHYNHTFRKSEKVQHSISCQEITLRDDARQLLLTYRNVWAEPFFDLIRHSNGQVYFLCGADLTGFTLYSITKGENHPFFSRCKIDFRHCRQEALIFWYVTDVLYHPPTDLLILNGRDTMNCATAALCDFSQPEAFPYRVANLSSFTWQTFDDASCHAVKWDEDHRLHLTLEERPDPVVVEAEVLQALLSE
ncbi:MAG: hypothetical protein KDC12_15530 [Flavobacteriales bacterium]|nr:hypothetical protein [Flavobacteriales bacterium]